MLEFILTIISSGGIGAAITYLFTFKSKTDIVKSEAAIAQTKAEHEKLDLAQDRYDYLQETLDKYIKDYYALDEKFRKDLNEVEDQIKKSKESNAKIISEKCNEIAGLKAQVTYLKGIRCYDFVCPKRIKNNPDKSE